jgi:glycosyltransferase 2 family protein
MGPGEPVDPTNGTVRFPGSGDHPRRVCAAGVAAVCPTVCEMDVDPPAQSGRRMLLRIGVTIFVLAAIAFFVFALVNAWHKTNGTFPAIWRLVAAGGLWAVGLLAAAYAWGVLLGGERRLDHAAGLLVSQLGKYIPGGVWQASGQVGLARTAGVRLQKGATCFSVFAILQAVSGANFALLLALTWSDAPVVVRVLFAIGAVASIALIDRRWMVWALHKIPRTRDASSELVPSQSAIAIGWLAALLSLAANSLGFALVLGGFGALDRPLLVVAAYAAAWTIGFVAIPIPSGVGIREAVLVGILHRSFPSSVIVAASVYHRLVSIAAEGLLAGAASHRVRPSRLRATAPVAAEHPAAE